MNRPQQSFVVHAPRNPPRNGATLPSDATRSVVVIPRRVACLGQQSLMSSCSTGRSLSGNVTVAAAAPSQSRSGAFSRTIARGAPCRSVESTAPVPRLFTTSRSEPTGVASYGASCMSYGASLPSTYVVGQFEERSASATSATRVVPHSSRLHSMVLGATQPVSSSSCLPNGRTAPHTFHGATTPMDSVEHHQLLKTLNDVHAEMLEAEHTSNVEADKLEEVLQQRQQEQQVSHQKLLEDVRGCHVLVEQIVSRHSSISAMIKSVVHLMEKHRVSRKNRGSVAKKTAVVGASTASQHMHPGYQPPKRLLVASTPLHVPPMNATRLSACGSQEFGRAVTTQFRSQAVYSRPHPPPADEVDAADNLFDIF